MRGFDISAGETPGGGAGTTRPSGDARRGSLGEVNVGRRGGATGPYAAVGRVGRGIGRGAGRVTLGVAACVGSSSGGIGVRETTDGRGGHERCSLVCVRKLLSGPRSGCVGCAGAT